MKHDYSDVAEFHLDTRVSKAGYGFNFLDSLWSLDNSLILNWDNVNQNIHPEVLKGFRLTIARLAEEVSASYTSNVWNYFRKYLLETEFYNGGLITSELILNILNCASFKLFLYVIKSKKSFSIFIVCSL